MIDFTPLAELADLPDRSPVSVRATLRHMQLKQTIAGDLWASPVIEESGTAVTCLVFSETFATTPSEVWREGAVLEVMGTIAVRVDMDLRLIPSAIRRSPEDQT
ncbi:hypothetical protein [Flexivirga alba]|uniref:OB domain-containing protein n=1 Tax=Flexivirga alba TaxID=702742 RepID=A0ABW2AEN8_9MICO